MERDINDCHEKIEDMVMRMQDMFKHEHIDEQMKSDWRYAGNVDENAVVKRHVVISD